MNPEDLGVRETLPESEGLPERKTIEWKRFFHTHPGIKKVLHIVGISAVTSIVVCGAIAFVAWNKRGAIAALLISTLPPEAPAPTVISDFPKDAPVVAPVVEGEKELTVTEVVAKVNPSVLSIEVSRGTAIGSRVVSRGTGFFVTSNGYVMTNRHVVDEDNGTYKVITSSGKEYAATLIAKDPVYDLAVLKVQGSGFPAVTLGDPSKLVLGQSVVAIGFTLGKFENSISVGVISGLSRSVIARDGASSEQLDRVIQTDAAINPGNSGGPLIDLKGNVIGVNVAVAQGSQNVGFAIPADSVRQVIDSVKTYGFIVRPYIGIAYNQITADIQKQEGLPVDYGVYISSVMAEGPAARAGIQTGDILLTIDGAKLDGDPSLSTVIRNKKVGQNVSVALLRDGVQQTLKVQLTQAPNL